jgi:mannose-1-phosphate guanylyltransferase
MREVVVVDAGDAVLVVPKDRSQDVRSVVQALRKHGLGKFE